MTDEREEGDEGDEGEEDEGLKGIEQTAVLKRRRGSQPVDGEALNAPGVHRLRPSEALALDSAAVTGMILRPPEFWQSGIAKFVFGLLIGLVSGGILGIMAAPDDVAIIPTEPLPVKTVASSALAIALTPEEKAEMFPATSTVTLAEMKQVLCFLPDLIPVQNAKPVETVSKPVRPPPTLSCQGRSGQDLLRCCQVMTENLPEYESKYEHCVEGGKL